MSVETIRSIMRSATRMSRSARRTLSCHAAKSPAVVRSVSPGLGFFSASRLRSALRVETAWPDLTRNDLHVAD